MGHTRPDVQAAPTMVGRRDADREIRPIDLGDAGSPGQRRLACDACYYLLAHGDTLVLCDFASSLREQWRDRLGDDDEHVRDIAYSLAQALGVMGRYAEARDLDQDTLERDRRILVEEHVDTLAAANSLVYDLLGLSEAHAGGKRSGDRYLPLRCCLIR